MKRSNLLRLATLVLACAYANVSMAQALEEIVVTARKKLERLQDVPIAVQAINGEFVTEQSITDVQALAPYIPNFNYATAVGAADLMFMRGVGNFGAGPQFEPSVGQVFDGYFISRSRLGRSAFLDLSQVEVLKGPQGAIIGKNTSLGAVSVTPAKPTEEFESSITFGHGVGDQEGPEGSFVLSGPLSDTVRARLAVDYKNHEGFVQNTNPIASYDKAGSNESLAARLTVQADLSDALSAEFLFQNTDTTREGKHRDIIFCPGPTSFPSSGADKETAVEAQGANCSHDQTTHAVAYDVNGNVIDDELTINTNVMGFRLDRDFANVTLTSLTGFSDYEIVDAFDSDQTGQALTQFLNTEEYDQFTQEFRLTGETDSASYIAGFFYMDNSLDFNQITDFPTNGWRRNQPAEVDSETVSVFGQADWRLNEIYTLTTGIRWTTEDREGKYIQYPTEAFGDAPIPCAGGPRACTELDPADNFPSRLQDSISEDGFSGNLSLQRQLESGILYASYANGKKSPGFAIVSALSPDAFVFEGEQTDQFELGGKHELLADSLRFNWALYRMNIEGLQTAALDPTVSVPVNTPVNADAISQGLETDLTWAASEALTISWSAAFSDAVWDGFRGDCWSGQSDGCTGGKQDLDGKQLPMAPDFSSVLGADYYWDLNNGIGARASIKWLHSSDYVTQIDHHPHGVQDSYNKLDITFSFDGAHGDNDWSVALIGKNITDEIVYQFSATPPNVAGTGGGHPRVLNSFPEPGRVWAVKLSYGFH